jgi:hypothetical protein
MFIRGPFPLCGVAEFLCGYSVSYTIVLPPWPKSPSSAGPSALFGAALAEPPPRPHTHHLPRIGRGPAAAGRAERRHLASMPGHRRSLRQSPPPLPGSPVGVIRLAEPPGDVPFRHAIVPELELRHQVRGDPPMLGPAASLPRAAELPPVASTRAPHHPSRTGAPLQTLPYRARLSVYPGRAATMVLPRLPHPVRTTGRELKNGVASSPSSV